jgi:hypothetical protein
MACASAVVRYWIKARACGVSLNIPNRSPATSSEPAYCGLMSGNGKKLKSSTGFRLGLALTKKSVMKLP